MKFRFVDQIISWTPGERIRGIKAVSFEEYSLRERLGDEPRLPETLLLESFLQLGNWLVLLSTDFTQCGLVVRFDEVRIEGALGPGERIEMELAVNRRTEEGWVMSGEGRVGGRLVLQGRRCLAILVPASDYFDPAERRVLCSELARTEGAAR